ncbi:MAG: DUF362 domain-containing protein [bacterium]
MKKVVLRRCERPDVHLVRRVIREGMEELGAKPRGKILVKPNVVTANRRYIRHSYTDPAVVEALVRELLETAPARNITIGESGGFGVPPGLFLRESGYCELGRRLGVRVSDFNHEPARWVKLERGVCHSGVRAARSLLEADYRVWAPKLKYHICCQITNALKLNVGILTHRDRMRYHDDRLNDKIVDLLEIGMPDLVITDAIVIGHGYESAPEGFQLGLIMVADDPLAADAAAAAILGYRPEEVEHLRLASERGYGAISLDDVEITGDVTIAELREKTAGIVSDYQDIHRLETPLRFYCGNEPERDRFCYGGCLAAVKGCLGTTDRRRPGAVRNARPGAIVTGVYRGDVRHPGQTVLLVGNCTKVEGVLTAGRVRRLRGCPIGTARLLFDLPRAFGMPSPALDARDILLFIAFTLRHLMKMIGLRFKTPAAL